MEVWAVDLLGSIVTIVYTNSSSINYESMKLIYVVYFI